MKNRKVILTAGATALILLSSIDAFAADKNSKDGSVKKDNKKITETTGAAAVEVTFSINSGKGDVLCGGMIKNQYWPGTSIKGGKFLSYSQRLSNIKKLKKSATDLKLAKLVKKEAKYKKLNKAAKGVCVATAAPTPIPPAATATPEATPPTNTVNLLEPMANATDFDLAHLYEKAALGAVPEDVKAAFATGGIGAAVDAMMTVKSASDVEVEAAKFLDNANPNQNNNPTEGRANAEGIKAAILYRLINTPNPFFERHAYIFLHNLLATSSAVLDQNSGQQAVFEDHLNLIRAHSITGDYRTLVKELSRDPAMLRWLTGYINIAQEPNEDFARELMELFTLGVKNPVTGQPTYTEIDVARVAKLTAGRILRQANVGGTDTAWTAGVSVVNIEKDPVTVFEGTPCEKTFNYDAVTQNPNDINLIEHIFACKGVEVSQFIAYRMAAEYVTPNPSVELIEALAAELRKNDFNMIATLKTLFKSAFFYSKAAKDQIITTPTDRLVTMIRRLKLPINAAGVFALRNDLALMGHIISQPPSVFGWNYEDFANSQWQLRVSNRAVDILANTTYNYSANDLTATEKPAFRYTYLLPEQGLETATTDDIIRHFQKLMNIETLSAESLAMMRKYLDNNPVIANNELRLNSDRFDPKDPNVVSTRIEGLLYMMFSLPQSYVR